MNHRDISDEQLLYLVGSTDKELFDAGMDIKQRDWNVPNIVMKKLGYVDYVLLGSGTPEILERIRSIFASIYRKQDLAMGGHIGVFMYRDIFARIAVPRIYGQVTFDPLDFVELTHIQRRIIATEQDQVDIYIDQFIDVADVQYGVQEVMEPFASMELIVRYVGLARLHLHSASAVLTGGYDYRGAVQASLLATELALKAAAAAQGLSEQEIKDRFGHQNKKTAKFIGMHWPSFDTERVERVLAAQPPFVLNRYSATQPDRRTVGHLVMGAQYIVAEIVRLFTDRNFRASFMPTPTRRYPE